MLRYLGDYNNYTIFYILGVSVSWSGSVEESEEERDKRLAEIMRAREISQKNETIKIILNFFSRY